MLFKSKRAWAAWLKKEHRRSTGVWVRFAKKGVRVGDSNLRGGIGGGALLRLD